MRVSAGVLARCVRPAAMLLVLSAMKSAGLAQSRDGAVGSISAKSAAPSAAADELVVPDGSSAELLAWIDGVAKLSERQYHGDDARQCKIRLATAIGTAADKVLAGPATDKQMMEALRRKIESLGMLGQLGDGNADRQADELLQDYWNDPRPAVGRAARQLRTARQLQQWPQLNRQERTEVINAYMADLKSGGFKVEQVNLALGVCDMLADAGEMELARKTVNDLMPLVDESGNAAVAKLAPRATALARRINLPGNKLELAGTLLDRTPLDWESYRGKVVLVQFWNISFGPCRVDVPIIIENYQAYHDQGFEVLGVSLDADRGAVERTIEEAGVPWPTLFSENPQSTGWEHPMARKYAITSIPRAILIDREGKVVHLNARGQTLSAELKRLLGEPSSGQLSASEVSAGKGPTKQRAVHGTR